MGIMLRKKFTVLIGKRNKIYALCISIDNIARFSYNQYNLYWRFEIHLMYAFIRIRN